MLTALAGTPLAVIERELASRAQRLAFEPPDFGALLGVARPRTIGGVLAANLAGSRRVSAGAARDHFLGCEAITGRGERFKAGGRVVKNVTGYDVPKLLAGSWGTLAVLTAVTLRVTPQPETERTLVVPSTTADRRLARDERRARLAARRVGGGVRRRAWLRAAARGLRRIGRRARGCARALAARRRERRGSAEAVPPARRDSRRLRVERSRRLVRTNRARSGPRSAARPCSRRGPSFGESPCRRRTRRACSRRSRPTAICSTGAAA